MIYLTLDFYHPTTPFESIIIAVVTFVFVVVVQIVFLSFAKRRRNRNYNPRIAFSIPLR
jgi:hypothetical protein